MGDRGAFVGIAGGFGTVTLGSSVLSPSFFARAATDPSDTNNYGIAKFAGATRLDKSINYTSPDLSGLTLRASMVQKLDNTAVDPDEDMQKGLTDFSIVYNNGPLTLAASMYESGYKFAGNKDYDGKGQFYGAAYDLGMVKLFANFVESAGSWSEKDDVRVDSKSMETQSFGVSVPMGALTLQADYSQVDKADLDTYVLSAQYALSKRTKLTGYTHKVESNDATYGAGIRHNF